jgi:DNA-binding LacI/PurR family transcriptional regulator
MAGIEDVAKLAGVSTATVSRALSGKAHVSDRAMKKVTAAANELGYVASHSAYTLATGRNRNIGVVLPYVDRWFFSVILESIESTLIEHGYDLTLYNLSGGLEQRAKIFNDFLLRKRVDAVLSIAIKPSDAELASLYKMKKPILGVGGPVQGAPSLVMDDFEAGVLATRHLISLGHTRIAHVTGKPSNFGTFNQESLRRQGYSHALKEAGLKANPLWRGEADYTIQSAYHVTKQLLGDPDNAPTAIFCNSDEMGFGTIMAVKDLGLRVPEDISVIGIDNHDMSEFFGLTTIDQRVRDQGREATLMILELLGDPDYESKLGFEHKTEWHAKLLIRSSTARPSSLR